MNNIKSPVIRFMVNSDVVSVVNLHVRAFPGFFLSFLGPRFLKEFYRSFVFDSNGVALVAEESGTGRILGVVAGPVVPGGYFRRLLIRRWWAFCLASVGAVLCNPLITPRLFRALFYRGEPPMDKPRALLSSIAVAPEEQKRGIGQMLVKVWVDEVRKHGAAGCYLTTDAENNDAINGFYEGCGWKQLETFKTPEGRRMNRYVLD